MKKYGFEHEALSPSLIIFLLPIKDLRSRVWEEVRNNYFEMMPGEYIKIVGEIIRKDNKEELAGIHE